VTQAVSLGHQAVRGAFWTIASGVGSRALGLIGTLVVTRFIAPAEYGEVTVTSVIVLTVQQLSTFGQGQYVIAAPEAGRAVAFHATFYHLVSGVVAFGALFAFGSGLGPLVGAPHIALFLPGLLLAAVIDRLSYIPERVLIRDMRFGALSGARSAGDVAYSLASVGLAALGWGAMAIVWGNLLRSVIRSFGMMLPIQWRDWIEPCRIRMKETRELFAFGLPLALAAIGTFAARRWDNLLVSRYFGPGTAGMYNLAYNLADVPAIQVGEQVGDVLFPSFSRLDEERRKDALLTSLNLLALVVFPLAVGLGAVAPTVVKVLFDPRWHPVAPMLVLLSGLSITRPIGWNIAAYLKAHQMPRVVMWIEFLTVGALLAGVMTLGRLSPLWTCVAVGIAFAIQSLAGFLVIRRVDGIPLKRLLGTLVGPLLASLAMALAVVAVRGALHTDDWSLPALGLAVETLVGAISYVAAALVVARRSSLDLVRRIREAFSRRRRSKA
jgi:PST family polysaccharide transporter